MYSRAEIKAEGLDVFRNFLVLVWAHLGLPEPDEVQLDIADYLQYGPKRAVIEAFRGAGKTWITAAYVVWRLFLNPQLNIKVVSAGQDYADDISTFIHRIISEMQMLRFLLPHPGQRTSAIAFDVGPAEADVVPSVSSVGIGGQITGQRADIIIGDDIETDKNSFTDLLRLKVVSQTKEFESVLKPDMEGVEDWEKSRILYLGTPHVEASLYNDLAKRGYTRRIWPSRIPQYIDKYEGQLGQYIKDLISRGVPPGTPVEPRRHGHLALLEREVSQGYTVHAMQYMLDPTPSDKNRFPLKTGDFLVFDMDEETTPIRLVHSKSSECSIENFPSGGLDGDVWRMPFFVSEERSEYQGTVMAIDPSGKGADETGYAIIRYAQGLLYWVASGGFHDGLSDETQRSLATLAVRYRVSHIAMEPNYGGGAFGSLLKPYLREVTEKLNEVEEPLRPYVVPTLIEDMKWARGQKEIRILDTLEPAIQGHRVVVSRELIEKDMEQYAEDYRFSVIYQMTRLTRDKGALAHEDRVEALAMAVEHYATKLSRDLIKMVQRHRDEVVSKELKKVIEISKMGGIMVTDRRIGKETKPPKRTIHTPSGNTPFEWRPGSGHW